VLAQADQLGVDRGRLLLEPLGRVPGVGEPVLRVREVLLGPVAGGGDFRPADRELGRGLDRVQAGLGEQLREPLGSLHPVAARNLVLFEQPVDLGQPVPAVPGQLDDQIGLALPQVFPPGGEIGQLEVKAGSFRRKIGQQPVQQAGLEVGEVVLQRVSLRGQRRYLADHLVVGVAFGQQRPERAELGAGPLDRFMRLGQVLEVRHDVRGPLRRVERLQHVLSDEIGEVADRFHRNGLMEQLHGLLGLDAESAAEVPAVVREAVVNLSAGGPQLLAQRGHVRAEVREVGGYRQRLVRGHVEPVRLAARVGTAQPEHLGDGDGCVVPLVAEDAQDHAVPGAVAERDRLGGPGDLVAFGLVVAEHVGAQRAFPDLGARGLVVGDPVGRQQQRGDRVDDGGLAGSDVASQQGVPGVRVQCPDPLVERTPVVQFQPDEPEAAQDLGHPASVSVASSAYSASLSSKSASHWASTNALRIRRTS